MKKPPMTNEQLYAGETQAQKVRIFKQACRDAQERCGSCEDCFLIKQQYGKQSELGCFSLWLGLPAPHLKKPVTLKQLAKERKELTRSLAKQTANEQKVLTERLNRDRNCYTDNVRGLRRQYAIELDKISKIETALKKKSKAV